MRATGVTRCLPTLITSPFDTFAANARVLARMTDAAIAGIHIEGPYISSEDGPRGAHPREHARPPDRDKFRRFHDAAQGQIGYVALPPELPGPSAFIAKPAAEKIAAAPRPHGGNSDQIRAGA